MGDVKTAKNWNAECGSRPHFQSAFSTSSHSVSPTLACSKEEKNRKIPISIGWNSPRPLRFRLQFALVWSSLQSTVEPSLSTKFNIGVQNVTSSQVDLLDLGCVFSSTAVSVKLPIGSMVGPSSTRLGEAGWTSTDGNAPDHCLA